MDHDQLFKQLLRTYFVEFIELFLPEVAAYLERDGIEFLDKEVFTDVAAAERHVVDLLVKTRFRDQHAFFLVHVETQSAAQHRFNRRMFAYFARLHEAFDLPVYPIALLTYDDPRRAERDRYEVEFPDRKVLDFSFRTIQLNRMDWRDFLRRPNPVAAALISKMQIAAKDRPRVKLECTRMIATLRLDAARQTLIRQFMDSYLVLSAGEIAAYNREVASLEPQDRESVMQVVNQWEEIGEERGKREMLVRLISRRLGALPASIEGRVAALTPVQLDALGDAIFDLRTASDFEAWLTAQK